MDPVLIPLILVPSSCVLPIDRFFVGTSPAERRLVIVPNLSTVPQACISVVLLENVYMIGQHVLVVGVRNRNDV